MYEVHIHKYKLYSLHKLLHLGLTACTVMECTRTEYQQVLFCLVVHNTYIDGSSTSKTYPYSFYDCILTDAV